MQQIILAQTFWGWMVLFVPPIIVIVLGLIFARIEDKRRKKIADGYPKAFKQMKISKEAERLISLDEFEESISN